MKLWPVALGASALLASCGSASDAIDDLQVAVSILPTVVTGGDTATVTVALVNPTLTPISVSGPNSCRYTFAVYDQQGVHVGGVHAQVCAPVVTRLDLAPGARDSIPFVWTAVGLSGQVLPAGRYTVVGASLWLDGRPSAPQPLDVVDP